MKDYKILTYILTLLLSSCGGIGDTIIDLGDGYFYLGEGKPNNYIYQGNQNIDSVIILPCVLKFDFDDKHIIASQKPEKEPIKSMVARDLSSLVKFYDIMDTPALLNNSVFKNRRMTENEKTMVQKIKNQGYTGNNMEKDIGILLYHADSILKNNNDFHEIFLRNRNFWIINKKTKKIFGPFSESRFKDVKEKLRVSKNLNLEK